jgi:hypothetical protein
VSVTFTLSNSPSVADRVLELRPIKVFSDKTTGRLQVTLKRTDTMLPAGRTYLVNSEDLGIYNKPLVLEDPIADLTEWAKT